MNRPTRNTMFGIMLCLVLAGVFSCKKAIAQDDAFQLMSNLRQEYEACVIDTVRVQGKTVPLPPLALAIETGFQACATEERAILSLLLNGGFNPAQAREMLTGVQLKLKRDFRESVARKTTAIPKNSR